jgi:hypothetical protein
MFNDYGYDYYQPLELQEYDESFYTEMMGPLKSKENFDNEIDDILEEIEPNAYNNKRYNLQNYLLKRNEIYNKVSNQCNHYKVLLSRKYKELYEKNNQLFMFYILLFISIIIIIYQKISIQNMSNLIYILKMSLIESKSALSESRQLV